MNPGYTHSRSAERAELLECEQARNNPRQRELFWDGGRQWREALDALIEVEDASDTRFHHQIEDSHPDSATLVRLEKAWHAAVNDDERWYRRLLGTMEAAPSAAPRTKAQAALQAELAEHLGLIEWRILQRRVVASQSTLEMLERRRGLSGRISSDHWQEQWSRLMTAFDEQVAAYGRLPDGLRETWLAWINRLHARQELTLASWGNARNVDRRSLQEAMAQVQRFRARLWPEQPSPVAWPTVIGAILVIGLIVVIVLLIGVFTRPAPTGFQGIRGTAVQVATATVPPAGPAPEQPTLNEQGLALLKDGACEDALVVFQRAYEAAPGAPGAYEPLNNRAFCLYELGRVDEARAGWEQALALNPGSPDANAGYALALLSAGRDGEAQAFYDRAVAIKGGYADELFLREQAFWGEHAISDSRPLRSVAP